MEYNHFNLTSKNKMKTISKRSKSITILKLITLLLLVTTIIHYIIINLNPNLLKYELKTLSDLQSVTSIVFKSSKSSVYIPSYVEGIEQYHLTIPGLQYLHHNSGNDHIIVPHNQMVNELTFYKLGDLLSSWNPLDVSPLKWIASKCYPNQQTNSIHNDDDDDDDVERRSKNNSVKKTHDKVLMLRFDYEKELDLLLEYRKQELPFIIYNIPHLNLAIHTNFTLEKLMNRIGNTKEILIEKSPSNQFIYYFTKKSHENIRKRFPNWSIPQVSEQSTFPKFLKYIEESELSFMKQQSTNKTDMMINPNVPLKYLSLFYSEESMQSTTNDSNSSNNGWVKDCLPMLSSNSELLNFSDRNKQRAGDISDSSFPYRGIVCRFGMRGMINAAHFDSKRNFVAILRGRRRFILLPPDQCENLNLYPKSHPSARHSSTDWMNILSMKQYYPRLYNSKAIETIVSMGEILYIPSFWLHYIITQDPVIQCNARSSESKKGKDILRRKCGFYQERKGKYK